MLTVLILTVLIVEVDRVDVDRVDCWGWPCWCWPLWGWPCSSFQKTIWPPSGRACIFRIPHLSLQAAKSGHKSSKDHWQEASMVVASTKQPVSSGAEWDGLITYCLLGFQYQPSIRAVHSFLRTPRPRPKCSSKKSWSQTKNCNLDKLWFYGYPTKRVSTFLTQAKLQEMS